MNFVRFVKTPRIGPARTKKSNVKTNTKKSAAQQLSMILTITTDFSPFAGSIELLCQLVSPNKSIVAEHKVHWTDVLRELKVEFPVPSTFREGQVVITPVATNDEGTFLSRFIGGRVAHVVGVETEMCSIDSFARQDTVYRQFTLPNGPLRIAEQTGETIIRHVWDAGIILSGAISCNPITALPHELQSFIETTFYTSQSMNILELGTGVGILGICIGATLPQSKVVMSDLVDAQALVDENIRLNISRHTRLERNAVFRELDWERRPFPSWTVTERFDLIVMADVTYNTATFAALADTLEHIVRNGSQGAKVVCCGKRRHDEEEGFWRIVKERGFVVNRRVIFAIDLDGRLRHCVDGKKDEGEQLVDFISMNL